MNSLQHVQLAGGRKISFLHRVCEKANAPTIVFVHGFPLDHTMWLGQLPLVDQASLVMPDLFGFGGSDPAAEELSMKTMANDVAELLNQLDIARVIFCGLSMGGYIGWEFVANHEAMLEGLICCNTRATADDEMTARARRVAAAQVLKAGAEPVAEAMRSKLFSAATIEKQPQLIDSVAETICATAPETIAAAQIAMSQRVDFSNQLPSINVPALVIAGTDDSITPSNEMQAMSMEIPDATFVELADAGHLSPAERPDAFNRALMHWLPVSGT